MLCEDVLCLSRRTRRRWRKRVGPCQNRRSAEEVVQPSTRLKGHVSRSVRRPLVYPQVHALQGIVLVPTYLLTCRPDKRARQMLASARHASPRRTNRVTLCEGRARERSARLRQRHRSQRSIAAPAACASTLPLPLPQSNSPSLASSSLALAEAT
jgi:hypothetical protein